MFEGMKPSFFVVGAAKAGTTSINHYLEINPDIYMCPIKEPHYFSKDIRCANFKQPECRKACINIEKYLLKKKFFKKHIAFVDSFENYLQLFRKKKLLVK